VGSLSCALVLCLASVQRNPVEEVALDRVDLIELNHFYDEQGRLVLDQLIFYDWSPVDSRYHVRAWRLLRTPAQIPLRNWRDRNFVAIWHDCKDRDVLREVHARMLRETWTAYDPELVEREFVPQDKRRDLNRKLAKMPLDALAESIERLARHSNNAGGVRRR
jgi:hypothetical protein